MIEFLLTCAAATLVSVGAAHAQAPLPADAEITWVHAPYEVGACGVCHASADAEKPGPVSGPVAAKCLGCHTETQHSSPAAVSAQDPAKPSCTTCTTCHNPHNSSHRMLLVKSVPELCVGCHAELGQHAATVKAPPDVVPDRATCLSCHDPHATAAKRSPRAPAPTP